MSNDNNNEYTHDDMELLNSIEDNSYSVRFCICGEPLLTNKEIFDDECEFCCETSVGYTYKPLNFD